MASGILSDPHNYPIFYLLKGDYRAIHSQRQSELACLHVISVQNTGRGCRAMGDGGGLAVVSWRYPKVYDLREPYLLKATILKSTLLHSSYRR